VKLFGQKSNNPDDKTFVEKAWDLQHKIEVKQNRVGKGKYGRVLKMARKPTNEEFSKTSKITGISILLVGGLGFLIFLLAKTVAPWIAELIGI
jgi:protein transport protein SEC61 subunit gamma-like protein